MATQTHGRILSVFIHLCPRLQKWRPSQGHKPILYPSVVCVDANSPQIWVGFASTRRADGRSARPLRPGLICQPPNYHASILLNAHARSASAPPVEHLMILVSSAIRVLVLPIMTSQPCLPRHQNIWRCNLGLATFGDPKAMQHATKGNGDRGRERRRDWHVFYGTSRLIWVDQ